MEIKINGFDPSELSTTTEVPYCARFFQTMIKTLSEDYRNNMKSNLTGIGTGPLDEKLIDHYGNEWVHIIRCKDCKHWVHRDEEKEGICKGIPFAGDDASYIETEENDYCSYSEKREDD